MDIVGGGYRSLLLLRAKGVVVGFAIRSRTPYHLIRVDTDVAEEPGDQIATLSRRTGSELTVNEVADGRDRAPGYTVERIET